MSNVFNKTVFFFLGLTTLPIVIALLFYPLWQITPKGSVVVPSLTMLLNAFIVPTYLLIIFWYFIYKQNISLVLGILLCFLSAIISITIQYWNWGAWSGLFWKPDGATKLIYCVEILIAISIMFVGIGILSCIKLKNR